MWYLKVSSSLLIAVALICMIQNAISLTIDPKTPEDKWSTLESSTDQNDLKKISKLCKIYLNNFNEKLENTKTSANKKLPEPNKTTEDIANLVSEIKTQVKNASVDLVTVRKLVQKTALRFRDTFKSLVSFTELENDSVNKELESIKKTAVDSKKPLVNRVIRSFGNRYDLNKLANKVLEITSDRENLKNNYDEKKKIAKREFNSLWNSLSSHSKTVNDNALKALDTFFEGMKSVKSVKKKVKTVGENALDEIKAGNDIIKLKNAVELAKALKLKFEDEWNLDSGELTYSDEQKKTNTQVLDENKSDVQENEEDTNKIENVSINDIQTGLPKTEQGAIENNKTNGIPTTQDEIEKLPMDNIQTSDKAVSSIEETQLTSAEENMDETKTIPETENSTMDTNVSNTIYSPIKENPLINNTENKDKTVIVQPQVSNKDQNSINDDNLKPDSSGQEISFNPDSNNDAATQLTESTDNKIGKTINKRTSREKTLILPWEKLIQLDNPQVSQQSKKCENLLNNVTPDFDNIKKSAKNAIQVTNNYKNLQEIENNTVKQFYNKMVDTNTKLCDYLVNAAEDVCAEVTPMNKRYEEKFKNDPNIKRIKYLLGKQYDPNQYILKILDDANHRSGIGGMKKTTYYKMLAVAHNLNHETQEMENAALYAMNKIHEGKIAATNLQKKFNKEKASKACYIRNILAAQENENDKKNKDENKEKVKESLNEDDNKEPLKQDVNLDSVDALQPSTINDDNEPIINNNEETKTQNEIDELINTDHDTEIPENSETEKVDSNKEHAPQEENVEESTSVKPKVKRRRKIIDPKDGKEISEEYEVSEEDENNLNKSGEKQSDENKGLDSSDNTNTEHDTETPEHSEAEPVDSNEEHAPQEGNDEESTSVKPKVKRRRKIIDPKDGKEISEEYEVSEEDENNLNKSGEKQSDENKGLDSSDNTNTEHDTETPEHSEAEPVDSNEEHAPQEGNDEESTSVKPKVKRRRKIIDPKDGKEISEEYEVSEEDENNLNKSGEKQSDENKGLDSSDNTNTEHDTETPEHSEAEPVDSNEEHAPQEGNDEESTSVKPKVKRRRKIIDPKDGKEISEEYEVSEEDENNLNKSGEKQSDENKGLDSSDNTNTEHDTETPEHSEAEPVDSNEEHAPQEGNDEESTSVKPKVKRRRKIIDPKDGKEISEEYEVSEEDENNLNKSGEKQSGENKSLDSSDNADTEHDTETPEHSEAEPVDSNEEHAPQEGNDEESTSVKPKVKRRRKIIDPKDGKEISEEYEVSEEDENNLNKSGEKQSDENKGLDSSDNTNTEHDTETPEHSEAEPVVSNEEHAPQEGNDEESTSVKPKVKRRRKIIDPKDGKEISEEYEVSEEDENNLNKSGEKQSDENKGLDSSDNTNTEHDTETPEHSEAEPVVSNEEHAPQEGNDEESTSVKPKVKRRRKIIDPKDGKEISEEYEVSEEDENNLNKSIEKNSNTSRDLKTQPAVGYVADKDLENITRETVDLEENENLNSLDDEKMNCVYNDNIIPAAESMGEDSSSEEANNGEPNQRSFKDPNNGQEITEKYDTSEGEKDVSSVIDQNINATPLTPNVESTDHNINEPDSERPKYEESQEYKRSHENVEPSENEENSEYNHSNKQTEVNEHEPDRKSNEGLDKSKDIEEQIEGGNKNNKKKRSHKKRKNPMYDQEESVEYETVEEDDNKVDKLKTLNTDSTDQFDEKPISNSIKGNIDSNEGLIIGPSEYIPKRRRNRKNPEYNYEESAEYDSIEDKFKKQTATPEINNENTDINNNVIPNIENDNSKNKLKTGYDEPILVPQTVQDVNSNEEPKYVNENNTEPEVVNDGYNDNYPVEERGVNSEPMPSDGYNVEDNIPETENGEPTEKDVDETLNNKKPRRRRNSRKPKSVNENENEPEVVNDAYNDNYPVEDQGVNSENMPSDGNNVQDTIPEIKNGEHTDNDNETEQPELTEYPENALEAPEASPENDVGETMNNGKPRRRRKSKKPRSDIVNENEPEVINDESNDNYPVEERGVNSENMPSDGYNVEDNVPETKNGEPIDNDNEIRQPELSEYPENALEAPAASPENDIGENINNGEPRPRKVRRRRKSRKPKSVKGNENIPEVVNDGSNDNYSVEDQGINSEPMPSDDYNVQDTTPVTEDVQPTENDVDEIINNGEPRPRRRHRKSRKPKSVKGNENEPDVVNDESNDNYPVEDQGINSEPMPSDDYNVQDTTPVTENSQPTENDVDEVINNGEPRPRRRRRKSRKPKSVKENENEPEVINDESNDNYPVEDQGINSGPMPSDDYNVQDTTPVTEDVQPTENDVDEVINNGEPRPRRRRRKSRKPKSVKENENEPEVINDESNDNYPVEDQGINSGPMPSDDYNIQDTTPVTEDVQPTENDVDEVINNGEPRPRRRRRKSRKPKSVKENENEPEVINDESNDNYPVEDQGINSGPMPSDDYNVQDTTPVTEDVQPTENDVDEVINNGEPRPRRRRRKSRKPKSVKENENEPEVINDESNDNYPVEDQGINSEPMSSDGYNVQDTTPETGNTQPTENDVDEVINNGEPRPRRRRRKSRKPKSVKENENEPEVINDESNDNYPVEDQGINSGPMPSDDYNVQDTTPVTEDVQPTENDKSVKGNENEPDVVNDESNDNYPVEDQGINSEPMPSDDYNVQDTTPVTEDVQPTENDIDEAMNNGQPRPRKVRRRRKSRKPKSVKGNENEPDVVNDESNDNYPVEDQGINSEPMSSDGYNVQDTTPETGNTQPTENDVDEVINNGEPRPRRRRRKSRKPKSVKENENEPEVINDESNDNYPVEDQGINSGPMPSDDYNVQDTTPVTEDVQPTENDKSVKGNENEPDVVNDESNDNYPVEDQGINSEPMPSDDYNVQDTTPVTEDVQPTENDIDEAMNNGQPRPRKVRRRRKSRKPKSVKENENEPEVINDESNDNYPVEDQGINSGPMPSDDYNVQDTTPVTEDVQPTENDVDEAMNNGQPRPRKVRRRRKSRKPKSVKGNENIPEVVNDGSNDNYPVEDQGINSEPMPSDSYNVQDTTPETGNTQPTENDVDDNINNGERRPRRRRRKSRKPKSVKGNENEPDVVNDESNDNYPVEDQGINSEPMPSDDYNVQDTTPVTEDVQPTENDVDEAMNNGQPRPRKVRRRRKSRKPKSVKGNENIPEVVNNGSNDNYPVEDQGINSEPMLSDSYNVQDTTPETGNTQPTENDVDENINNGERRPRRRRRKSRKPKSVKENENEPEVINDERNDNYPVEDQGINSEPMPSDGHNVQDTTPETENSQPTENDVDEAMNNGQPRPRKVRRRRKSRKPKSVKGNENIPEVVNNGSNDNYPVEDQGINSEPMPSDGHNVQDTTPETGSTQPTENDVDENINNGERRPRRRRRKSRKPKSVKENENEPEVVNHGYNDNCPAEDRGVSSEPMPSDGHNVQDTTPETGNTQPTENDVDENINNGERRPRRRRRKSRKPKSVKENENEPEVFNHGYNDNCPAEDRGVSSEPMPSDDYNVQDTTPVTEDVQPTENDVDEAMNNGQPRPRRRRRKSSKPKSLNENEIVPEVFHDENNDNNPVEDQNVNNGDCPFNGNDLKRDDSNKSKTSAHIGMYPQTKPQTNITTPNNEDVNDEKDSGINEKPAYINETDGIRVPDTLPIDAERNPKRKRRIRRVRRYMVNRETNERIPINDETYSTTDGLPDTKKNELKSTEIDDPDTHEDNDDYSSFLFKEYNSDQCKRDAYDRFKKVTSQDAKQIAYRSVLDTSEMRSNMLATIKNAIGNVKISKTFNDVDQSLRTVSFSLKTSLKQTVSDLVTKVIPLAKDFLTTAENLKELYKNGPQSTHKMLSNILENESTVPDSAKDVLKLISPQFDVDELINNIFDKPFNTKTLKEKKAKAQRKLIDLSKHMDIAISNIDCFILSAMSAVGIGADTLKLLKSGRVIMSDKHPRAKALRDAVGIIKSGKKIRNNDKGFAPTSTSDGATEKDEDDDDEDPDAVAQKDEEFLKTVPDLDDIPVPKKVKNKRQSLGVIVVHPDKQIEYKEVKDTSQLKQFVGEQTKKYKWQSKSKHPKFLKLNSKQLINNMVEDVKKKAERNGMSKKEMVQEIINNLKSN